MSVANLVEEPLAPGSTNSVCSLELVAERVLVPNTHLLAAENKRDVLASPKDLANKVDWVESIPQRFESVGSFSRHDVGNVGERVYMHDSKYDHF